ncbi:MAG: SurA N-terminal domain-containing protein [Hyphomicrobiaceae bacterium]|nr:SurA N-terminal domain-containing protein [Hyphomicrobiaceae bacterium]
MLNALRRSAASSISKIFIALLVVSFAVWGISDVFRGNSQQTVMQVGDARISAETFRLSLNRELALLSQQVGREVTLEQARLFGFERQLLGKLATDAAMDARAQQLGLGLSEERLGARIASDPIFDQVGGYDPRIVRRLLQAYGLTEADFVADTRNLAMRQQMARALVGGMQAPQAMIELGFRYLNEQRSVSYFILDPIDPATVEDPDEEALTAFFEENREAYEAPEMRSFVTLALVPNAIVNPDAITDDQIAADYEANRARYSTEERRRVVQLLFQSDEAATAARERLVAGETPEAIADDATLSATLTEFGTVERRSLVEDAIAESAFSLETNGVSEIIEGRFGPRLVYVAEILPPETRPLEEVSDEIRQNLALTQADEEIFSLSEAIEDARAGGETLAEIAARYSLTLESFDMISGDGKDAAGEDVSLPEAEGLLSKVFESDIGLENDYLSLGARGFLWFEVTDITLARPLELDEVRDQVIARWKEDAAERLLQERADAVLAEIREGATLEAAAEANGVEVQSLDGVTRETEEETLGTAFVAAVFEGPRDSTGQVETADGTARILFRVDNTVVPAFFMTSEDAENVAQNFAAALQDGLLTQMVGAIQDDLGVRINQGLVDRLTGASQ